MHFFLHTFVATEVVAASVNAYCRLEFDDGEDKRDGEGCYPGTGPIDQQRRLNTQHDLVVEVDIDFRPLSTAIITPKHNELTFFSYLFLMQTHTPEKGKAGEWSRISHASNS